MARAPLTDLDPTEPQTAAADAELWGWMDLAEEYSLAADGARSLEAEAFALEQGEG